MRTLWQVLCVVLLLHTLLLAGAAGWLRASGRLTRERVERAAAVFALSVAQEEQHQAAQQRQALEQQQREMEAARLESAAQGPVTVAHRLAHEAQRHEIAELRVERLKREVHDLRQQLQLAQDLLTRQKRELDARRADFEQWAQREERLRQDADFRQAVQMYEQLRPQQVKDMFQALLKDGRETQVIDYLAAMQLRKAGAVLKEFKTPEEIAQAAELVQRLRERGVDPMGERAGQIAGGAAS